MFKPIILSLKVAVIAVSINFFLGLALAKFMAHREFTGKVFLESLITLPMVLPPSVVGYGLLLILGNGGLGKFFDIDIVFTWWAAVIAASIVSFPLMYQSAKTGIMTVDAKLEKAARTLGASEWRVFKTITFPLAWPGIASGIVLSFARSLGEFGATLMVAGNIPGVTQTIPLAIYFASETGDTRTANLLVLIMTILSFLLLFTISTYQKRKHS